MHGKTVSEWERGQQVCPMQRKRPGWKQQDPPPPRRPGSPPKMAPPLRFPHLHLLTQTVIMADPSPPLWGTPAAEEGAQQGAVEFG